MGLPLPSNPDKLQALAKNVRDRIRQTKQQGVTNRRLKQKFARDIVKLEAESLKLKQQCSAGDDDLLRLHNTLTRIGHAIEDARSSSNSSSASRKSAKKSAKRDRRNAESAAKHRDTPPPEPAAKRQAHSSSITNQFTQRALQPTPPPTHAQPSRPQTDSEPLSHTPVAPPPAPDSASDSASDSDSDSDSDDSSSTGSAPNNDNDGV